MNKFVSFTEASYRNGVYGLKPLLINLTEVESVCVSDTPPEMTIISMKSGNCFRVTDRIEDVVKIIKEEKLE